MKKLFCSGSFGLALLCFCLPWVTVSCQQQKMMTTTGIQLVSGMEVAEPGSGMFGAPPKKHRVEPNGLAILALVAAGAGIGLSLMGGRASALPALAGLGAALVFKTNLDQDILKQGQGLFQATYEAGFVGYLVTMGLGLLTAFIPEGSQAAEAGVLRAEEGVLRAEDDGKTCPRCAERIRKDAVVCRHCGAGLALGEETAAQPAAPWSTPMPATNRAAGDGAAPAATSGAARGPELRFCPQCGTATMAGAVFCCECGTRLAAPTA